MTGRTAGFDAQEKDHVKIAVSAPAGSGVTWEGVSCPGTDVVSIGRQRLAGELAEHGLHLTDFHPIRHDRSRELGAFANPRADPDAKPTVA